MITLSEQVKMNAEVILKSVREKCDNLDLELISTEIVMDRVLIGCKLHMENGVWGVDVQNINLKNKLANCAECFSSWCKV